MLGIHKIKVPVTTYHEVEVSARQLIDMLRAEQKKLLPKGWDYIEFYKSGRIALVERGYGSHNMGQREEDCTDEKLIHDYSVLQSAIALLIEREENK